MTQSADVRPNITCSYWGDKPGMQSSGCTTLPESPEKHIGSRVMLYLGADTERLISHRGPGTPGPGRGGAEGGRTSKVGEGRRRNEGKGTQRPQGNG